MKKKNMVIPWLSLSCILMGILLNFDSAFECGMSSKRHILPIFIIAGIVIFLVFYLRANYAVIFTLSAIAGLGIFVLTEIEKLQQGFLSVVYYINQKSLAYNNKTFISFEGIQGDMDQNLFLFMSGVIFAIFITFFVFRLYNCWYGMLPVYAVLCLGMAVGKTPNKAAVAFLIAGVSLAMAWVSGQQRGGRRFFVCKKSKRQRLAWTYAILSIVLSVGLTAAWQYGKRTEGYVLKDAKEYLKRQHEMERQAKRSVEELVQYIRSRGGRDSNGTLSNVEPKYKDETVIKLTVSEKPKEALYLRGFVGGEYENGRWRKCDTASFRKIMTEEEDVEAVFDVGYEFCKDGLNRGDDAIEGINKMKMEHVGTGRKSKFAYLPYFFHSASVSDDTSNKCITYDGENGIYKNRNVYSVDYYDIEKELLAHKAELAEAWYESGYYYSEYYYEDEEENYVWDDLEWESVDWKLSKNKLAEYYDYVEKTYGRLPETGLDRLRELAEAHLSHNYMGAFDRANEIRSMLEQRAFYDRKLDPVPLGEDYVEYFLWEQRRGYCEHFATAGVLLLRTCQIPARYASGYKVTTDRFKQNKDGTYTAEVLDSDAHAWAEVFNAYYGWYPAEMTPGEGADSRREDTAAQPEQTLSPAVQKEEEMNQTEKPEEMETLSPAPTELPQNSGKGKGGQIFQGGSSFFIVLAGILLLLFIPASYVVYQRHIQNKYRKKLKSQEEDKNAAIRIRTELFLYFLKKCGKRRLLQKSEAEWFIYLAEEYKEVGEEVWQQLKEILQEAEFSNESVSTEKYEFFFGTIAKTEKLILSRLSWGKCVLLRMIGCLE